MKAEEEYQLSLKYLDELKKVYDDKGNVISTVTQNPDGTYRFEHQSKDGIRNGRSRNR